MLQDVAIRIHKDDLEDILTFTYYGTWMDLGSMLQLMLCMTFLSPVMTQHSIASSITSFAQAAGVVLLLHCGYVSVPTDFGVSWTGQLGVWRTCDGVYVVARLGMAALRASWLCSGLALGTGT